MSVPDLAEEARNRHNLARLMLRISQVTDLQHDDEVILFPSLADLSPDGRFWRASVSGLVYSPGRVSLGKKVMLGLLRRAMKATREQFSSEPFVNRISGFLVEARKGRTLAVRLGDHIFPLSKRSRRSGMFSDEVMLPTAECPPTDGQTSLRLSLVMPGRESQPVGDIYLVPSRGLSIVSDIDDTVKHTEVLCRRSMLSNTFLCDFSLVPGIVDVYRKWQQSGAMFHYVSSSPWQLYSPLANFFSESMVPQGSFHLRAFKLSDHMLRRLFLGRRPAKAMVIKQIMQRFPERKFVLVGDSGEHDPEIYGTLARRFPNQVAAILVRRVPGQQLNMARFERAFRRIPTTSWQLFEDPGEVAGVAEQLREKLDLV